MQGVNKVILVGRISSDIDCKNTKNGMLVANCSLATSRKKGDDQITEFHNLVFWDKLAEIVGDFLHKGSAIYIEGSLSTSKYDDPNGGSPRSTTKIHVQSMQMLDKKEDNQQGGGQQRQNSGYQRQQQGGQSAGAYSARSNQNRNQSNQGGYKSQSHNRNAPPQHNDNLPDDEIPF